MHRCMRCGRTVETIEEMDSGCTCGSKVFVYSKGNLNDGDTLRPAPPKEGNGASKQPRIVVLDIENVRMLEKGVFEVDLGALLTKPLVLKDEEEVYHVRLPLAKDSGVPKKSGTQEAGDVG